jgi:thioredoxin-related protein
MRRSAAAIIMLLLALASQTSEAHRIPGLEKRAASRQELLRVGLPEVLWRDDYDSAFREAVRKKRPLLLFFHDREGKWSRRLEREISETPGLVQLLNRGFVPLLLDTEAINKAVRKALRIDSNPTILVADRKRNVVLRLEGYRPPAKLSASLHAVLDKLQPAGKRPVNR